MFINKKEYLSNPCGTLSIPYWKNEIIKISSNIEIIHKNNFKHQFNKYQRFYRLLNKLDSIENPKMNVEMINLEIDKAQLIEMINICYKNQNISVTDSDIINFTKHPTYSDKLWIKIMEKGMMVASGIAEYDKELNEGVLEWIQVLPEYQNKGYGKDIVNALLMKLQEIGAQFVTVSGNLDNINSLKLYKSCGFIGDDIWYICEK